MSRYRRVPKLRSGRGGELRSELDEEIRAHLEMRTEALIEAGWSPDEARREAERRFGDLEEARAKLYTSARHREARLGWRSFMEDVARDLRVAARQARHAPGYAATAVGIFGLGIMLTTTMFTIVDHVLLRPLPYPEPDRLVSLQSVPESGTPFPQVSMANWVDWRNGASSLAATALHRSGRFSLLVGDQASRVDGTSVSGEFFAALRADFVAGRPFTSAEGQAGEPVAVVSEGFALRRFGEPGAAVGRGVAVNGRSYAIVGVLADRQALPRSSEIWVPERFEPGSGGMRNNINYEALARLSATASLESARSELAGIARSIRESDPEGVYSFGVGVRPLQTVVVGDSATYLRLLMGAVTGVLLIACANLAGLGLARARRREQELAVRLALGSGRTRIVRQILTEHALLAVAGGGVGLAGTALVASLAFDRIATFVPRAADLSINWRVAAFALAVSIASGLLAGLLPSLRASDAAPGARLTAARGRIASGRRLPGAVLVGTEVAIALAMLVGGGLLLRSFQSVVAKDLGFDPEGVITAEIALTGDSYAGEMGGIPFWSALVDALERAPGVERAAVGNWIPTGGSGTSFIELEHDASPDFGAGYRVVSDRYFETLGIPLRAGRAFGPEDVYGGERVAIVNDTLAARAWPGRSAIGQRIRATSMESWMHGGEAPWLTVVGVVGDVRHHGFEVDARPEMFVLYRQLPDWTATMTALVRPVAGLDAPLGPVIRDRVRELDPGLAVDVDPLDARVRALLGERRLTLDILVVFAVAALFLTCLGIYGLVAYAVEERTREMAIRAALGARRSGLLSMMLVSAARVLLLGAVAGVVAARWLSGFMESLLVDVTATDPLSYVLAALVLCAVGLLAALVPSLRAARMDPVEALSKGG